MSRVRKQPLLVPYNVDFTLFFFIICPCAIQLMLGNQNGIIKKKEVMPVEAFAARLSTIFRTHGVVSVGEYHDSNQDQSFNWILGYGPEILTAYNHYWLASKIGKPKQLATIKSYLEPDYTLLKELDERSPSLDELRSMHVSRLFCTENMTEPLVE